MNFMVVILQTNVFMEHVVHIMAIAEILIIS